MEEEVLSNPEIAVGTGYSESKWVAERILDVAAERTALRPVVVRLGQVCGDGSGTWNENEWFPSLVKSGLTLGCLPSVDGVRSPIDLIPGLLLTEHIDRRVDYRARCSRRDARDLAR